MILCTNIYLFFYFFLSCPSSHHRYDPYLVDETLRMSYSEDDVTSYTLSHAGISDDGNSDKEYNGLTVTVMTLGATITSVQFPDRDGVIGELTLGYEDASSYRAGSHYFGCVAGRVANRIAGGAFSLDGTTYNLATNNGPNHLHGGDCGFDKRNWRCLEASTTSITMEIISPDGEEGYPGDMMARVTYSLPTRTKLRIEYTGTIGIAGKSESTSMTKTPINLTNHTYWNLRDGGKSPITDHWLELAADFYTPVDESSIPTGEIIRPEKGSPMDLSKGFQTIASHGIHLADQGMGYDHNWCLRVASTDHEGLHPVARVYEPKTGRSMVVRTTEPGVQFYTYVSFLSVCDIASCFFHVLCILSLSYAPLWQLRSGNYLDGFLGRGGTPYSKHHGFCLETQHFPDSVNRPQFPPVWLSQGETYRHITEHTFDTYQSPSEAEWE